VDAVLAQQVQTVIYPSICFAYPDSGAEWIDATLDKLVVEDYYVTTFDAEQEMRRFTDAGGKGIVLRMGFFYGPESPQSQDQLRFARLGIASVVGRPDAYHPFVMIEDAAQAIVAALEHATMGRGIMSVMSRSQRVSNRRFKDATGWSPRSSTKSGAWDRVAQAMRSR